MHLDAYAFVAAHLARLPVDGLDVLEIGSYDVNGTIRPLCLGARSYLGIDVRPGPGVDLVWSGAAVDAFPAVDVVLCCEVLEHTAEAAAICRAACGVLRPGGRFLVTCATDPRAPHGRDGEAVGHDEFYRNVSDADLRDWLGAFTRVEISGSPACGDLYAVAVKACLTA